MDKNTPTKIEYCLNARKSSESDEKEAKVEQIIKQVKETGYDAQIAS